MKTADRLHEYAQCARDHLRRAREDADPVLSDYHRSLAAHILAEGKQLRSMKRQADMFRELFGYARGRR